MAVTRFREKGDNDKKNNIAPGRYSLYPKFPKWPNSLNVLIAE